VVRNSGSFVTRTPFHEPLESVDDTDHVATADDTTDRDSTNNAVDPRRRSAPNQNTDGCARSIHTVRTPVMLI